MRYCENCGRAVRDQASFCVACSAPTAGSPSSLGTAFSANCGQELDDVVTFCAGREKPSGLQFDSTILYDSEGAYDKFENRRLLEEIYKKLNLVCEKLDEIKER